MRRISLLVGGLLMIFVLNTGEGRAFDVHVRQEKSDLSPGFIAAIETYAGVSPSFAAQKSTQLWLDAFKTYGIDAKIVARRLRMHNMRAIKFHGGVKASFAPFLTLKVEEPTESLTTNKIYSSDPVGLHLTKLYVAEEYDDVSNDDIYVYTITTYGDRVWGQVSDIYKGMDEGDSVFFNAKDRGVFGPRGQAMPIQNHLIVDIGIIESDGDDIKQMKALSDIIIDLAVVAISLENPQVSIAAAKARQEVKNLLHLIISLENDDRLIADSMYFSPDDIANKLSGNSFYEFKRRYETESMLTHFDYEVMWRFLKP